MAQGQLSLQWLPPLEQLAEQLDYQVRYTAGSSPDWKVPPARSPAPRGSRGPEQPRPQPGSSRRCCRSRGRPGDKSWTCGRAPATAPRCGPGPWGRGTGAAGAPGPSPWRWTLRPTPVRAGAGGRGPGAGGAAGAGERPSHGRRSPGQAGSCRAPRCCRWGSRGRCWGCAAPSPRSAGKDGAGMGGRGGAAPGACPALPCRALPSTPASPRAQHREAAAVAARPGPAARPGQLPARQRQAGAGEGRGGAGLEPPRLPPARAAPTVPAAPRRRCTSSRRRRRCCPACWRCCPAPRPP